MSQIFDLLHFPCNYNPPRKSYSYGVFSSSSLMIVSLLANYLFIVHHCLPEFEIGCKKWHFLVIHEQLHLKAETLCVCSCTCFQFMKCEWSNSDKTVRHIPYCPCSHSFGSFSLTGCSSSHGCKAAIVNCIERRVS